MTQPAHALTSLNALLAQQVAQHGGETACIDAERPVSFAEFDGLVRRSAGWLAARGVGRGDVVALWLVNGLPWLALYFALARLGAAAMTVNTRYRAHEVAYILERSKPRLLVLPLHFRRIAFAEVLSEIDPAAAASLQAVVLVDAPQHQPLPARLLDRPVLRFDLAALPDPAQPPAVVDDPDAPSILFTTSGTTSGPKLVVHSQRSIAAHVPHVAAAFGFRAPDAVLLAALPFNGVFGFVATLAAFAAARPAVLMPTFDADEAVTLVQRHAITHCFGSDEMFELMAARVAHDPPFPTLRVCGYAAFRAGAQAFAARARQRGLPLRGLYGSSEVQALFSVQPEGLDEAELIEGGGRPVQPGAQVRVRDVDSGELLPPGRSGALEIRAPGNFMGYLNNPEATAAALTADGFFRTGDLGRLRADGTFVYETRQGDAIRLAGYLVAPAEIEEVLLQAPGVAAAQVVAVEIGGKTRAVAFVIAANGIGPAEAALIGHAAARLAAFKVPARVWPIEEFPVVQSANGTKIQRNRLREMALARLAAEPAG